jgi:imidazolonepropionase-like amidohydrolase
MAALIASTKTNARLLRQEEEIGTIEEGKVADLLLVDGDPISDIDCLEDPANVQIIVKRGAIKKQLRAGEVATLRP